MLRKLLKYDMRSVGRFWWLIPLCMLGLSTVAGFLLYTYYETEMSGVRTICLIFFTLCVIGISAASYFTPILCYIRFYRHFYTDEGYLTFTLPVRRRDLLRSKILNTLIWTTLHTIWLLVCICLILMVAMSAKIFGGYDFFYFWRYLWEAVAAAFEKAGVWAWIWTLEALLISFVSTLLSINLIHFCITLGAMVAARLKFLAAIGFYFTFNAVTTAVLEFALLFGWGVLEGFFYELGEASANQGYSAITLLLFGVLMILATVSSVFYCMTRRGIERKLNLA